MGNTFDGININCDLGEGIGDDVSLMPYLNACNIACGGHYGDADSMRSTIELALKHDVKVGAHPSFPDRDHFGRKELKMDLGELESSICEQVEAFNSICNSLSTRMHHLKLHGALYNLAARDEAVAAVIVRVLESFPNVSLYAPYNSVLARLAEPKIHVYFEAFVDRAYEDDGSLVTRATPGAVINSPKEAWSQLHSMFTTDSVTSIHGNRVSIKADTFCIHGDNENVLTIMDYIHSKIQANE